jgi:hypothetical protein
MLLSALFFLGPLGHAERYEAFAAPRRSAASGQAAATQHEA